MSDTQDTLIERAWNCGQWPAWLHVVVDAVSKVADEQDMSTEQAIAYGILTALADRDAKIAELERERDEAREGDEVATSEMQHWRGLCEKADGEIGMLRADFNDCNSERARWRKRAEVAEAQVAELTQKLERAMVALEPFANAIRVDETKQPGDRHYLTFGTRTSTDDLLRAHNTYHALNSGASQNE